MASIHRTIEIAADAEFVWDAVRDVGAVHRRLAHGFVVDVRMEPDARVVTFGNGAVVREVIVDIDDARRRFAYAAVGGRSTHHNASLQVIPGGERRCTLVWIADVLPNHVADVIGAMVEQAAVVIQRTLEAEATEGY